jgi:AhpD family alkylhydroperoxidase
MTQRIQFNPAKFNAVFKAMLGLNAPSEDSSLEPALLYLIKVRGSQINGCGFCLDMHTKDARLAGETEQRLYMLSAWRSAPFYSDRERAALAWTEALTKLENQQVSDEVYKQVTAQFNEDEVMRLTLAVVAINGWNRFQIALNAKPGTYKAGSLKALQAAG